MSISTIGKEKGSNKRGKERKYKGEGRREAGKRRGRKGKEGGEREGRKGRRRKVVMKKRRARRMQARGK